MADETEQQNPFMRRGFITAAVLVAVLIIVGAVVIFNGLAKSDDPSTDSNPTPQVSTSATPSASSAVAGGASVCGLKTVKMDGKLNAAPDAEWRYVGAVTYPGSSTYGPADKTADGFSMCFERTPSGAVFAAAAGMAQLTAPETKLAATKNGLMPGALRDAGIEALTANPPTDSGANRQTYSGFKLLSYDGNEAVVDLGITTVANGKSVYASILVPLIWHEGDWKMNFDQSNLKESVLLPNLAGYALWKE